MKMDISKDGGLITSMKQLLDEEGGQGTGYLGCVGIMVVNA